jgi:UDP-GlcNAc:undecaprenyl-phosphate GlcNAc-1-phosphate transferase
MLNFLIPFLVAFGVSLALVPLARALARKAGVVAHPKADRWHRQPTALLGGVAIAITVLGCALAFDGVHSQPVLFVCGLLICLVGLADDVLRLRPSTKLVAQIALASIFVFFHYRLDWTESRTLDSLLTILWVVGITNAFNLLDNMDGLCAGIAIIAGAAFVVTFYLPQPGTPEFLTARYAAMLSGAVAGFLVYNFHPASIFMGDSGSMFIGLSFAALALVPGSSTGRSSRLLPIVVAPVVVLLVPILDTTLVTLSRMVSGRSAAVGGRDHSSHRLVAIGLSERSAVAVLWILAGLAGLVGVAMGRVSGSWSALITLVFLVAMMIFTSFLARVRVYEEADVSRQDRGRITPVVEKLFYKQSAAEVMLDFSLVALAYYGAYRLRFDDIKLAENYWYFLKSLPVALAAQMLALFAAGAYRSTWKYFGLSDTVTFAKAVVFGSITAQLVILYLYRFEGYSRAVFLLDAGLLFAFLTLSRASFRLFNEFAHRRRQAGVRLAIYGAGDGGALAVRELLRHPTVTYRVVGFIDDDAAKRRLRLHGYAVLGGYDRLATLIQQRAVDAVVISARRFDPARQRELEALCSDGGVALSRLRVDLVPLIGDAARET